VSLRIGVDMDGTLADLASRYHVVEAELFGQSSDEAAEEAPSPETGEPTDKEKLRAAKEASRRRDRVWTHIRSTPDFWTSLEPIESGAVRALFLASVANDWEIFFVTQRPRTAGRSVQAQTQSWLISHGFETPSVLTLSGSRGKAAHALELDCLIDDTAKNCVDVVADSKCRPILVVRNERSPAEQAAQRMQIATVRSVTEAIELLSKPKDAAVPPGSRLSRVLSLLGLHR
jgi:hypothetical protein